MNLILKTSFSTALVVLALAGVSLTTGCTGTRGRVMSADEGTLVGARRAGQEVYDSLVRKTVAKILDDTAAKKFVQGRVAFVGIENSSAEELGDHRDSIFQKIDTLLVNSNRFSMVSKRAVDAALTEVGMAPGDLFLKGGKEEFVKILRSESQEPQYLMWGVMTTSSVDGGGGVRQVNYQLTLEMTNLQTAEYSKQMSEERKTYE